MCTVIKTLVSRMQFRYPTLKDTTQRAPDTSVEYSKHFHKSSAPDSSLKLLKGRLCAFMFKTQSHHHTTRLCPPREDPAPDDTGQQTCSVARADHVTCDVWCGTHVVALAVRPLWPLWLGDKWPLGVGLWILWLSAWSSFLQSTKKVQTRLIRWTMCRIHLTPVICISARLTVMTVGF